MGAVGSANTRATDLAFDRVVELLLADEAEYPNDTALVPADLPDFEQIVSAERLQGRPVLVVYPDGSERLIKPDDPSVTAAGV